MNELTITQLGTFVGLAYTLFQFSQAKANHVAQVAEIKARVNALEGQMKNQEQLINRIDRSLTQITTAIARLEERMTALDAKLDREQR